MTILDKLNKKDYDKLKELFNEYCNLFYKKQYPFTLNNVVNYCEQALLHHVLIEEGYYIEELHIEREPSLHFQWCNGNEWGTFISSDGMFWNESILTDYNKYLKNEFTGTI